MAQEHDLPTPPRQDMQTLPAGAELRAAPRFTLLIRAAKLIADGREFLCIIRDASATGLKVRLFTPLPEHKSLLVELGSGERYPIEVVWAADDHVGVRFVEAIDVERLLHENQGNHAKRQVRLRIALEGLLYSGGETVPVSFDNISQQGARIESEKWLLINELVRIETSALPPIYAKVRWRNHPHYGLLFEQTFKLDELARISATLQPAPDAQQAPDSGDSVSRAG